MSKKFLENFIKKYPELADFKDDLRLSGYNTINGKHNHEKYINSQVKINKLKNTPSRPGPSSKKMHPLAKYFALHIEELRFGLCHGTRRGREQKLLKEYLKIPVLGTEIAPSATEFKNTIQWDFHEVKDEWIGNVSFIYSNSLDHSYDPVFCLRQWMSCIHHGGMIALQRGQDDLPDLSERLKNHCADLFQASPEAFEAIVDVAGAGDWEVLYPERLVIDRSKRNIILQRKGKK